MGGRVMDDISELAHIETQAQPYFVWLHWPDYWRLRYINHDPRTGIGRCIIWYQPNALVYCLRTDIICPRETNKKPKFHAHFTTNVLGWRRPA